MVASTLAGTSSARHTAPAGMAGGTAHTHAVEAAAAVVAHLAHASGVAVLVEAVLGTAGGRGVGQRPADRRAVGVVAAVEGVQREVAAAHLHADGRAAAAGVGVAVLVLELTALEQHHLHRVGRAGVVLKDAVPGDHEAPVRRRALLFPGHIAAAGLRGVQVGPVGHQGVHRGAGHAAGARRGVAGGQIAVREIAVEAGIGPELQHAVAQDAHAAVVGAGEAEREAAGEVHRGLVVVARVGGAGSIPGDGVARRLPVEAVRAVVVGGRLRRPGQQRQQQGGDACASLRGCRPQ